jgi:hypothetical protein
MAIQTIEQALAGMGQSLTQDSITQRARAAVAAGDVLEITILISPGKSGAAVTMHSLIASDRASHGRLIRLK